MVRRLLYVLAALCAAVSVPVTKAQELRIALQAEPTSIDPLYHTLGPNNQIARHIFSQLVHQDPKQRLIPGLALSWKPIDDGVWEFKLRPGVKFQDGAPLTPEDVVFSIDRAPKVP
ncbi:MAG TPA: ABC transporter substrate-binding protein, partial [Stellaceae bacterium]|nr:ABC transporter substrate-binding protein [Stellaceae bacterium]